MLAVMGPSGSGKTTFLTCLRQDISHAGDVRFSGERFHRGLRRLIGFVEQDDVVFPQLTVRQSLSFLAELRFGIGSTKAAARVEEVVDTVCLGRVVDSVVGEPGHPQRISGGERKRLCIARELLGDPRLIICDEPTSGLDSTMAEQVIRVVRSLSDSGKVSVVASIHQPSSSIFAAFDDLALLREGHTAFFGPTMSAEGFFVARGPPRDPVQSVSEYLMDLLVLDEAGADVDKETAKLGRCGSGGLPTAALARILEHFRAEAAKLPSLPEPVRQNTNRRNHEAPMLRQVLLLTRRHSNLLVSEAFTVLNLIQNVGLMFIAALLWWRLSFTESDVFPRWGACMWTVGTWMFFPLFGGIGTFPSVKRVLEKELRVGCYSLPSFYVARTVLLLPIELIWPTVWVTGVFWITNMSTEFWVYLQVLALVYMSYSAFAGVGLAISASGMPPARSGTMAILLITFFFAWSGFFVDLDRVPRVMALAAEVNPFRFSVELMMQIIMQGDVEFVCGTAASAGDVSKLGKGCALAADGTWVLSGAAALERHGMTTDPWLCVAIVLAVVVMSRLLAFGLLWLDLRTAINGAKGMQQPPAHCPAGGKEADDEPSADSVTA